VVRSRAGKFANRSTTISQGTLIPAILESGFDSTRAGLARALIQRDVRGFDGSRVLIPRGSRLIGDYQADAAAGQNRALILWTRLIRPDGGTIAFASPVTDTEGRTGVRAHVNSHFLARFSNAFLQTFLYVGATLATQSASSAVVVALPGSFQGVASTATPNTDIKPTLTVRPGTSISVLAARDLDFTEIETQP
jgi:type IV secretion system protein VirB10